VLKQKQHQAEYVLNAIALKTLGNTCHQLDKTIKNQEMLGSSMLKKILLALFILVDLVIVAGIAGYFYIGSQTQAKLDKVYTIPALEMEQAVASADLALGERIVRVRNGCIDCHGSNLAGAKIMDNGAMGKIYGSNITPAALSNWSDEQVARAIRHGVGLDNKPLVLMPSHDFLPLSQGDLAAIIAYLRSVPAVDSASEPIKLGPVSKALLTFEKAPSLLAAQVIDHQAPFASKPPEAVSVEFGKYLAQSACAGCHGPSFMGGPIPGGDPKWPPASDLTQLKSWDAEAFKAALRDGVRPGGEKIQAPMPPMALDDIETEALWLFIQSL